MGGNQARRKIMVQNKLTTEDEASAPDGKLYVINVFATARATYKTPNKGHVFVESEFQGEDIKFSTRAIMKVNIKKQVYL